jgi:hypothetical protein
LIATALERRKAVVDHDVNDRQKSFNLFAAVNQLDDNGQGG